MPLIRAKLSRIHRVHLVMLQISPFLSQAAQRRTKRELAGRKLRVIVLEAREQVAVHVEGHLDRAMTE